MTKLEELIKEFCPNGVEYKKLGELGKFYGGLSGKSKNDFTNGNEKFITYKNVYANPSLNLDIEDRVKINPGERQNTLQYGDIIFTGSSETPDECGFSSVITTKTSEKLYLNSFCFFFRLDNQSILLPDFAKHLFRAESIRYQIGKTASGVTRYNVSKDKMKQVQIPLPALPVQREIVRILDSFTLYSAELTAELTARRKQYEFYRDKLLNFSSEIQFFALGDVIVSLNTGLNPRQFFHLNTPDAKNYYVTIRELQNGKIVFTDKTDKINDFALKLCNNRSNLEIGDVLFSGTGTIGTTAIIDKPPLNWNIKEGVYAIKPNKRKINSKFLMYLLQCQSVRDLYLSKAAGGTVQSVPMGEMKKLKIPVPPMEVQERIVKVLDNFDAICSDLGIGLPAEIEKRQKQYEYYREKLLTFDGKYATILTERNGTERNGTERNGTERAGLIRLLQYVYGFAFVRLGDIADIHTGTKPENILENVAKCEYINAGTTNSGYTSISNCEGDCITTPSRGQGGIGFVGYQSNSFWLGPLCYCIRSKNDRVVNKYLFYYLSMNKSKILELKKEGGVPAVNRSDLQNVMVKIPTLEKQKEIVEILDKFDSLCNDLSAGLPAEIEHRQKQYEYYRDKLLTF